jgi:hypothetical protein
MAGTTGNGGVLGPCLVGFSIGGKKRNRHYMAVIPKARLWLAETACIWLDHSVLEH